MNEVGKVQAIVQKSCLTPERVKNFFFVFDSKHDQKAIEKSFGLK